MLAAATCGMPVAEYAPLSIKSSVEGYGLAAKEQVQFMVTPLQGLDQEPTLGEAAEAREDAGRRASGEVLPCLLRDKGLAASGYPEEDPAPTRCGRRGRRHVQMPGRQGWSRPASNDRGLCIRCVRGSAAGLRSNR